MKSFLREYIPFVIITLLIIITSLVVILFAEQYKFNPKTGTFTQTGMIEVRGIDKAEVYIDNQLIGTSPKTIYFVDTGNHTITLKKEGRKTWERNISVLQGKVTMLFPIMFPDKIENSEGRSVFAVIPTSSPHRYLTIEFINDNTEMYLTELSHRLLDIGIKSSKVATLTQILEEIELSKENIIQPLTEQKNSSDRNLSNNKKLSEVMEKLAKLEFNTSPKGRYILIANQSKKVYLVEVGQNNIKNVSAWFDLTIDGFYWSPDEDWVIIKSQTLLISINLKTGQRFILYNISEDKNYGPVTPIKGGVVFVVNEISENNNIAKIFRIDNDSRNLQENPLPENGFRTVKSIFPIESAGVLLINADNRIWKQTSANTPPILVKEGYEVIWSDNDERWACSVNITNRTDGIVLNFNPMDPEEEIQIEYPVPIEEIERIFLVNGHQNIVFQTGKNIVIATEDGKNAVNVLSEEEEKKYFITFLSTAYHRGVFILQYGIFGKNKNNNLDSNQQWQIKEIRFEN